MDTPSPICLASLRRPLALRFPWTRLDRSGIQVFIDFLALIDPQLNTRQISRLESTLMPANFSSIVIEFMSSTIPKHCRGLVKNLHQVG